MSLIAVSCSNTEWPRLALAFPPGSKWVELVERNGAAIGGRKVTIEEFRKHYHQDFIGKRPVTAAKLAASYLQSAGYHATQRVVKTLEEVIMSAVTLEMTEQEIIEQIVALADRLPEKHKWRSIPKRFASKKQAILRYEEIAKAVLGSKAVNEQQAASDGAAIAAKVKEKVAKKARTTNGTGSPSSSTSVYKAAIKTGEKKMNAESNRTKVMIALWAEPEGLNLASLAKASKLPERDVSGALSYLLKKKMVSA